MTSPAPHAATGAHAAQQSQPAWPATIPAELSDAAGTPCVDVPPTVWGPALEHAWHSGYTFLDWLSAVDEPGAERLAGKGDLLVRLAGHRTLLNLQGRYLEDAAIAAAVRDAMEREAGT